MKYFKILYFLLFFLFLNQNVYSKIDIDARNVILVDHLSGKILYEKNADDKIYPASMTKIITTKVAFELIKKGETSLDEMITVSEKAWRMSQSGYSSMFIMLNDQISVEDLLNGIESKTKIIKAIEGERRHCNSAFDFKSFALRRRLKFSVEISLSFSFFSFIYKGN